MHVGGTVKKGGGGVHVRRSRETAGIESNDRPDFAEVGMAYGLITAEKRNQSNPTLAEAGTCR